MKINPTDNNKKTLIDNVTLALTTILGVGGALAGAFIPESALLVAGIQAGAYFPTVFAIVLKQMIVSDELSKTIAKQIDKCSAETAKQHLKELKKTNITLYTLFASMWSSDDIFDSGLTLESIKERITVFIRNEAKNEGYFITHKDINDALDEYTRCFFINMRKYPELNQLMLLGQFQAIEELVKKVEVFQRRLDNEDNDLSRGKSASNFPQVLTTAEQKDKKKYDEGKQTLLNYADAQKKEIKRKLIFPWFNESKSLRDVFPKLFVTPKLIDSQTKDEVSDLSLFVNRNLMILGDAGTGKSTLLNYWFAFKKKEFLNNTICLYFNADSTIMRNSAFKRDFKFALKDRKQHYLFIIDGLDETFLLQPSKYKKLISKLQIATNCNFWLGCRQDFYKQHLNEKTKISDYDLVVQEWGPEQISFFINQYSEITENSKLSIRINRIKDRSRDKEGIDAMKKNPFQLSVLVFLAEQSEKRPTELKINSTYDLYDQFIELWVDKEINRNTSPDKEDVIYDTLYDAANSIYYNNEYIFNEIAERNTAVNGLLQMKSRRRCGKRVAKSFYHRSLAAFIIASRAYRAIYEGNIQLFIEASEARSRDDITNFLVDKFASIDIAETYTLKRNIINIYNEISDNDGYTGAKQQLIYYITRLGIDVSGFIVGVIRKNPSDLYMRLSLAYGCVLSENPDMKKYALAYARSIAADPNGDDAITNRGWTAVYFNDVNIDEKKIDIYGYRDTIKGMWKNSREARLKRFTNKNPRYKDLRFWIFDIPLFRSFLIDRGWDNLSDDEYRILKNLKFHGSVFDDEEIEFLTQERDKLLAEYKNILDSRTVSINNALTPKDSLEKNN